jgi:hypothetical protein
LLQGPIEGCPVFGRVTRRRPAAHKRQLSSWTNNMNPLRQFVQQSPISPFIFIFSC